MLYITEIEINISNYMCDDDEVETKIYIVDADNEDEVKEKVEKRYVSDPYGTYYIINFNYIHEMIT